MPRAVITDLVTAMEQLLHVPPGKEIGWWNFQLSSTEAGKVRLAFDVGNSITHEETRLGTEFIEQLRQPQPVANAVVDAECYVRPVEITGQKPRHGVRVADEGVVNRECRQQPPKIALFIAGNEMEIQEMNARAPQVVLETGDASNSRQARQRDRSDEASQR